LGWLGWGRRKITIMKKTYMNPSLKVVEIKPAQILAGSEIGKGNDYNGGTVQTRQGRFSSWEEDDEE